MNGDAEQAQRPDSSPMLAALQADKVVDLTSSLKLASGLPGTPQTASSAEYLGNEKVLLLLLLLLLLLRTNAAATVTGAQSLGGPGYNCSSAH